MMVIHSGAKWQFMDSLSVLKAELTEARAKVSALANAIRILGGKSGTYLSEHNDLWCV
jgi:hypothetical protein